MKWGFDNDRAIYQQIVEQLERAVVSGEFKPGEKLSSVRDMALEAGVNPNTMQRAMAELEGRGLIVTQRTAGRFVTDNSEKIEKKRFEIADRHTEEYITAMQNLRYENEEIKEAVRRKLL